MIYRQLREKHPLHTDDRGVFELPELLSRAFREVLRLLEEARAEVRDEQTHMNKLELLASSSDPAQEPGEC
ncbi:hypothetical protein GBAR_LOCUS21441 [Geodia barretti]|uniref:Uncharacterized protein n=1 Tax=Geodia barretti TaxID=519541 RepID=A0AA35X5H7_GEOBA|nr:hypothetical protein GBAR_LOCUS21441 [Geodia barretti]